MFSFISICRRASTPRPTASDGRPPHGPPHQATQQDCFTLAPAQSAAAPRSGSAAARPRRRPPRPGLPAAPLPAQSAAATCAGQCGGRWQQAGRLRSGCAQGTWAGRSGARDRTGALACAFAAASPQAHHGRPERGRGAGGDGEHKVTQLQVRRDLLRARGAVSHKLRSAARVPISCSTHAHSILCASRTRPAARPRPPQQHAPGARSAACV